MAAIDDINEQPDSPAAGKDESNNTPAEDAVNHSVDAATGNDSHSGESPVNMEFLLDVPLEVTVELGRTKMLINDMLKLGQGSVIELSKLAGESLEILANQKPIARGEVVVVNEKYGVRLTEVISPMERVEGLR